MPTLLRPSSLSAGLLLMTSSTFAAPPDIPAAPVARVEPVTDSHFGETLVDRYRWMENNKDPAWLPFLKGQNDHTRAVLEALPRHAALLARVQQLSGDIAVPSKVQRVGSRTARNHVRRP